MLLVRCPTLLIVLALLLWGWQNNALQLAIMLATPLYVANWVKWRIQISDKNFNLITDMISIIFFLSVIYQFSNKFHHGIFYILESLPYLLYPLILAQFYSKDEMVPLQAFFFNLRRKNNSKKELIDISFAYLIVLLLSASTGNNHSDIFYTCMSLLVVLALYSIRPKRYSPLLCSVLLALATVSGYMLQNGFKIAHHQFEYMISGIFNNVMWGYRNPNKTRTAIGYIGTLKLSDQIHLRVKTDTPLQKPLLLHEASYADFGFGLWSNEKSNFENIEALTVEEWQFATPINENKKYNISVRFKKIKSIIPTPINTYKIANIEAVEIEREPYGAIKMEMRPGWIRYDAYYDDNILIDTKPQKHDLEISPFYQTTFEEIAEQLALSSKTPRQIVATVENYFSENFSYSLIQHRRRKNYLHDFLFHSKKGHCEYFATATVLLLRAAGIPARYAVGYSVQEYSDLEEQYIARARDTHSWVIAYVDGAWRVVDTTPSVWAPLEATGENWWQPLFDLWSWSNYRLATWFDTGAEEKTLIWPILLVLAILYFFWRLLSDSRFTKIKDKVKVSMSVQSGIDSPLYLLTHYLEINDLPRKSNETIRVWLLRTGDKFEQKSLLSAINMHYRYRFDPIGLSQEDIQEFHHDVKSILQKIPT